MEEHWFDEEEHDMSQPRYARYKHVWTVAQEAVYWSTLFALSEWDKSSTRLGRMRSLSMTLYFQHALKEWYPGKIAEILYTRISKSPRPAHTIIRKAHRQTNLDQNAEESASSSQLARTGGTRYFRKQDNARSTKKRKVKKRR